MNDGAPQADWAKTLERCAEMQPVSRGTLPASTCLQRPPFSLQRYEPLPHQPVANLPPILLVYSLVNRPDLLDMAPGRSLISDLLEAGFPVYMVDWGYPLDADRSLDLEDYVPGFLGKAVDQVLSESGHQRLMLVGVCQGGTLSLCHALARPAGIGALVTLATPVDFHAERNALSRLAETVPEQETALPGDNINGQLLSSAFAALKPADLLVRRYRDLPALLQRQDLLEEFLRLEAWMYDCPDQPAAMFHRFLRDFYIENRLVTGRLEIRNQRVSLDQLTIPVFNAYAADDHLVPRGSARALGHCLPADTPYQECELPGGHLGVFLSRRNRQTLIPELERMARKYL